MNHISRVGVLAKPRADNTDYDRWQTADIAIFVKSCSYDDAMESARRILLQERWDILSVNLCDLLIEQRVREQGGKVYELYKEALSEGHSIIVFPRHFGAGPDGIPTIRSPRVTESFMDKVVADVGGCRLEADGKSRMVDYRIEDWLFEMKDLQREGLLQPDRQKKLAELFRPYTTFNEPMHLNPEVLEEVERQRYYDIIGSPIQGQVKSASKQIRATKERLGSKSLQGGIIYLNTGYGSFPQDEFGPLVERFVRKDTTQIAAVLAISTWSVTNGFLSNTYFKAYPPKPEQGIVRQLQEAFSHRFEQAMTKLVTGELDPSDQLSDPLSPLTFNIEGLDFSWLPPELSASWWQEGQSSS